MAETLSDVYQEQVANGMMPTHDTEAAEAAARERIMLGIVGIFIPLTATDVAIDAAMLGFGRVARLFDGAAALFSSITRANRLGIDEFVAAGSQAARRADAIKMQNYPGFSGLDYADVVRIEAKVGEGNLGKLKTDFANTPGLAAAFKNDPSLANAWKSIDDLGVCSFDGSTAVATEFGYKRIDQLTVGIDRVLARDELSGAQSYKPIVAKYSNQYSEKVIIQSTNTDNGERLSVVSNKIHPIFVKSREGLLRVSSEGHTYQGNVKNGAWVDASELVAGDRLLNGDGSESAVTSIEIVQEEFEAFNLTVQDFSTYSCHRAGPAQNQGRT